MESLRNPVVDKVKEMTGDGFGMFTEVLSQPDGDSSDDVTADPEITILTNDYSEKPLIEGRWYEDE